MLPLSTLANALAWTEMIQRPDYSVRLALSGCPVVLGDPGDEVPGRFFPQCVTAEEAGQGVVVVDVLGVAEYELPGEQLNGDDVVVVDHERVVRPVADLNAERQDADTDVRQPG